VVLVVQSVRYSAGARRCYPIYIGYYSRIGLVVSIWFDSTLSENGQYTSFAAAYLSGLLNFGAITFLVLAFGALFIWYSYRGSQKDVLCATQPLNAK
jgi:hypothetical protein